MKIDKRYTIDSDKIAWRIVDGEAVILNLETGLYYSLDKVGTRAWQFLSEKKSCKETMDLLVDEYEVEKDIITKDLLALIDDLEKEELIEKEK
jgi:hypothetical protein